MKKTLLGGLHMFVEQCQNMVVGGSVIIDTNSVSTPPTVGRPAVTQQSKCGSHWQREGYPVRDSTAGFRLQHGKSGCNYVGAGEEPHPIDAAAKERRFHPSHRIDQERPGHQTKKHEEFPAQLLFPDSKETETEE